MADFETRSVLPPVAGLRADRGEDVHPVGRRDREMHQAALHMDRRRALTLPEPQPVDAVLLGTCLRCGITGRHSTPAACIKSLRDRLAKWE